MFLKERFKGVAVAIYDPIRSSFLRRPTRRIIAISQSDHPSSPIPSLHPLRNRRRLRSRHMAQSLSGKRNRRHNRIRRRLRRHVSISHRRSKLQGPRPDHRFPPPPKSRPCNLIRGRRTLAFEKWRPSRAATHIGCPDGLVLRRYSRTRRHRPRQRTMAGLLARKIQFIRILPSRCNPPLRLGQQ